MWREELTDRSFWNWTVSTLHEFLWVRVQRGVLGSRVQSGDRSSGSSLAKAAGSADVAGGGQGEARFFLIRRRPPQAPAAARPSP